jgi:hypothetical protein
VHTTPEDPLVAERMALHRAADSRRQAMRLDRAGDHAASRQLLHETHALLHSAPQSAAVVSEMSELFDIAEADASKPLTEDVRKNSVAKSARMGRGREARRDEAGR